ncbi:MAG: hypothetical protein OIF55_14750, partial [Amphritea sp.]|nr:hypothetical protein [Amphritea sp.]
MYRDDTTPPISRRSKVILPPPMVTDKQASTNVVAGGVCKDPLMDLMHITGNKTELWLLDATAFDALDEEVQLVEKWLSEYRSVFQASAQATDPEEEDEQGQARMHKLEEGIELGIIALGQPDAGSGEKEDHNDVILSQDDIAGLISSLQKDRKAIEGHSPHLWHNNLLTRNYEALKQARL